MLCCNYKRSNVLYNLAKGVGTLRGDSSDSRFPMPMGLVEYAANFFVSDNLQKVCIFGCVHNAIQYLYQITCPPDYRSVSLDKSGQGCSRDQCGM